jgi:hypothetical protein
MTKCDFKINRYGTPENVMHVFLGIAAVVFSVVFLRWGLPCGSAVVVGLIDGYLLCLLFGAALVSDGLSSIQNYLPMRVPCLILFACLLTAVLLSFANIYLHCNVGPTSSTPRCVPSCHDVASSPKPAPAETGKLEGSSDAIYFSAVTLTTLGYGDYAPRDGLARGMVLWELGTGILMIILLLPLLICRIALFEGKEELRASEFALKWELRDVSRLLGALFVLAVVVLAVMWAIWHFV